MSGGFNPNTWPTLQQSMPMAQGFGMGEALRNAMLKNQMQKTQNQFQPELLQQKLAQMIAATQGQQISNEQAPEMLALREALANISAANANTSAKNIGVQNQKMPALYANALSRFSNNPAIQSMLSDPNNPMAQQAMKNIIAGAAGFTQNFSNAQDAGQAAQSNIPMFNFPTLQKYMGNPAQTNQVMNQPVQGQAQQPYASNQQQSIQSQVTPEQIQDAQDATRSRMEKQNNTSQTQNARNYANNLEFFGKAIEENLPKVKKYFGAQGRLPLFEDWLMSKFGHTTPEYQAYIDLTKTYFPGYASEFGREQGYQATDEQKKILTKMVSPDFSSSYDLALNNFKGVRKREKEIAAALAKSPAQIRQALDTPAEKSQSSQIEMVDSNGQYHMVDSHDVDSATGYGWRKV